MTGTSDKLPVEQQLEMIRAILPDAKKIGIMYTTSEVNSASTLAEYKEKAADYGFDLTSEYRDVLCVCFGKDQRKRSNDGVVR